MNNKTRSLYEPHIQYLHIKLDKITDQLSTFEPNRVKRGLVDGLGSIVKSISGNLDYTDAIKYNNAIKILQNNEHKLETEFNNHISLSKEWMTQHSKLLSQIYENQSKMSKVLNLIMSSNTDNDAELIKYAHFAQYLLILSDNIEELSDEIRQLEYLLAFIHARSTFHSMLSTISFKSMINRLKSLYSKDEILDLELREYYDIIKLGSYYINKQVVIVFKLPIFIPSIYTLYKLSVVPNKNHQILIPTLPYIALQGSDSMYIETECPKSKNWYLREDTLKHRTSQHDDCIQHLITKQSLTAACHPGTVSLTGTALEQLDDMHYTLSFPRLTKIQISCGQERFETLQGSYLATIPASCSIKTPDVTLSNTKDRVKGHALKLTNLPPLQVSSPQNPAPAVILNSMDLEHLQAANTKISLQAPLKLQQDVNSSLYHTTIPTYTILLSAVVLSAAVILYRQWRSRRTKPNEVTASDGTYALPRPQLRPSEIKVDIAKASATFSKSLK